jgi:hypothetical protein
VEIGERLGCFSELLRPLMLLVYKDLPGLTAPSLKVVEIGVASNTSSPHLPFHPFRLHFSPITLHRPALSSQSRQSWLTYTQSGLALQHQWILHFIISLGFSPSSAFFSPYSYTIPPFSPPPLPPHIGPSSFSSNVSPSSFLPFPFLLHLSVALFRLLDT